MSYGDVETNAQSAEQHARNAMNGAQTQSDREMARAVEYLAKALAELAGTLRRTER